MDPASIRAYAARDWESFAAAKRAYWADRYQREGLRATVEASRALLAEIRHVRPDYPTEEERRADLAGHVRLRMLLTGPPMPSPVAELLRDLASSLDGLDIEWYVFGAQAAIVHGAARLTADVDVTVLLPPRSPLALSSTRWTSSSLASRTRISSSTRGSFLSHTGYRDTGRHRAWRPRAGRSLRCTRATANRRGRRPAYRIGRGHCRDEDPRSPAEGFEDVAAVLSAQHASFDATYARRILVALEQALGQSDLLPVFERLWSATGSE